MITDEFYTLSDGIKIPKIGFGTWQTPDGEVAYNSVRAALDCGYRHIDTAYAYHNEESIGKALKDSLIPREKLFIATKLPAEIKSYEGAEEYFYRSLKALNCEYIDLYLIHAPWPWNDVGKDCTAGNIEAWKALIELKREGKIKSIGVSNFHRKDVQALIAATSVIPSVNQIRYFIGNTQEPIYTFCKEQKILIEAYSPIATGELTENTLLRQLAEKYGKSIPKICLRYCLQKGTLPLPKSTHEERIKDNIDLDFTLSDEDMAFLDSLKHIASTRKMRD